MDKLHECIHCGNMVEAVSVSSEWCEDCEIAWNDMGSLYGSIAQAMSDAHEDANTMPNRTLH